MKLLYSGHAPLGCGKLAAIQRWPDYREVLFGTLLGGSLYRFAICMAALDRFHCTC